MTCKKLVGVPCQRLGRCSPEGPNLLSGAAGSEAFLQHWQAVAPSSSISLAEVLRLPASPVPQLMRIAGEVAAIPFRDQGLIVRSDAATERGWWMSRTRTVESYQVASLLQYNYVR